jgi:hypothetical protein
MMMHRSPGAEDYERRMQDADLALRETNPTARADGRKRHGFALLTVSGQRLVCVWQAYGIRPDICRHPRPAPNARKADPLTRLSARSDRPVRWHSLPWFRISWPGRCAQMARLSGNQELEGSKLPAATPIRSGVNPMLHSTFDPQFGQKCVVKDRPLSVVKL